MGIWGEPTTRVSTSYFGSIKHRALNCSAPSTAPGTEWCTPVRLGAVRVETLPITGSGKPVGFTFITYILWNL